MAMQIELQKQNCTCIERTLISQQFRRFKNLFTYLVDEPIVLPIYICICKISSTTTEVM